MANVEKAKALVDETAAILAVRFNLYRFEGPVMDLLEGIKAALDEDEAPFNQPDEEPVSGAQQEKTVPQRRPRTSQVEPTT